MRPVFLRVLISVTWIFSIGLVWLAITQRPIPEQPLQTQIRPIESPTPIEIPTPIAVPSPTPEPRTTANFVGQVELIIPVAGVKPDQLIDTFDEARTEGRLHDAIDIMAPAGTPVLAATDGKILRLFQSERGGTTIYQLSRDEKTVYYYAHLERYADNLTEGSMVRQGDVIAYVGDTGNAGAGNYHLHFSMAAVSDPTRYWEGTNINPYPLLRR
ncbi:MAG TPA: peptidoglycan DD-metalloendopeptidase family protein [Pyrinomonadaceae bacterium]|nr:peptidoglycan DD-metalloendopeptidase family protein [Pyrinomonadaceae bacterium]